MKDRRSEILTSLAVILSPHVSDLKQSLSTETAERFEYLIKGEALYFELACKRSTYPLLGLVNLPTAPAVTPSAAPVAPLSASKRKVLAEVNAPVEDNSPTKKRKSELPETPTKRDKPAPLVRGLSELASKGKSLLSSRRQSFLGSPRTPSVNNENSVPSSPRRQSITGRI